MRGIEREIEDVNIAEHPVPLCSRPLSPSQLESHNRFPLSRSHPFSQNSRTDLYHHFVPLALWLVVVKSLLDFDGDEIGGNTTTDGCLREGSIAVGL